MTSIEILTTAAAEPIAPAGIWMEAINPSGFDVGTLAEDKVYDPRFHEITYIWTLRGSPLAPYTAPDNMVAGWNDANRAWGPQVAFVLPRPGTYTVELRATDRSGNTAMAETRITVHDPDKVYPGARTICFSSDPAENWTGAPEGSQRATHPEAVQAAIDDAAAPLRLLFRRGQTAADLEFLIDRGLLGHVGAWGDGPRPVLRPSGSATIFRIWRRAAMEQISFSDLDLRGGWDSTTEMGKSPSSPFFWAQMRRPCHYTVWNCDINGFDHINTGVHEDLPSTMLFSNCRVTNWRNYGFLGRSFGARLAFVGMMIAQHPEALHGGDKGGVPSNNHGPLRIPTCARVYIGTSDIFSRTGWSGLTGERADQPCLRLNTGGRRGAAMNLDRIVCEGGYQIINMTGVHVGREENPGNYLIDKALLIGTAKTIGPFIAAELGGLTVRNTIGVLPNAPRRHRNNWQGGIRFGSDNPGAGNTEAPMTVYSSTFLSLLDSGNDPGWNWTLARGAEAFDNYTEENNVVFAPEMDRTVAEDGRLDLSAALEGVRPRFRGVRYNFDPQSGKLAATVPPGGRLAVPYEEITTASKTTAAAHPTSRAYWQMAAPDDNAHVIRVGKALYRAEAGEIAVEFGPEGAAIVNTSGENWEAGARWTLRLDRRSRIPPMQTAYASPARLPLPRPSADAAGGAARGLSAKDDFLGRPRAEPPSRGALERP